MTRRPPNTDDHYRDILKLLFVLAVSFIWGVTYVSEIFGPQYSAPTFAYATAGVIVITLLVTARKMFQPGPLLAYDAIAQARRGRQTVLRTLTGAVILLSLYFLYTAHFRQFDVWNRPFETPTLSLNDAAKFAQSFLGVVLSVQYGLVVLLTPTLVAEVIVRDKERKAIDFLLVTDLSDGEIIYGRLFGRLAHVANIIVVLVPVLAMTLLFGGVTLEAILGGAALSLGALVGLGGMCVLVSTVETSVLRAVVIGYVLAVPFMFCAGLPYAAADGQAGWSMVIGGALMASVGFGAAAVATTSLRRNAQPPPEWRRPIHVHGPLPRAFHHPVSRQTSSAGRPQVSNRPLLWKEIYLHSLWSGVQVQPLTLVWIGGSLLIGVVSLEAFISLLSLSDGQPGEWLILRDNGTSLFGALSLLSVIAAAFHAIAHTANGIVRERERDTLQGLLTLPDGPEAVLKAKWLGAFAPMASLGVYLAVAMLSALLFGLIHPASAVLFLACAAVDLAFLASAGLVVSLASKTSLQANLGVVAIGLAIIAGPLVMANAIEAYWPQVAPQYTLETREFSVIVGMPPAAWRMLFQNGDGLRNLTLNQREALLWHLFGYTVGASVLWQIARAQFAREGGSAVRRKRRSRAEIGSSAKSRPSASV